MACLTVSAPAPVTDYPGGRKRLGAPWRWCCRVPPGIRLRRPCPAARRRAPGSALAPGRAVPEGLPAGEEMGFPPEHPAQVVPDLPASLAHQAVSAPTRSSPEVSLSIVNTKSKKKNQPPNPTDFPQPGQCLVEGRCYLFWFILFQTSLFPHLFKSSLELSVSRSNPASDSSPNTSDSFHLIIIFSNVKPLWETLKTEITV